MNKFKLGDTVWTVKRGKGMITDDNYESTGYRPFKVFFEGYAYPKRPKLSNLYRCEAEMLEAKKARWNVSEFTVSFDYRSIPIVTPKFKQGDKVYYEGKKWEVLKDSTEKAVLVRTNDYGDIFVHNTNLRLWKEHEFTHIACGNDSASMRISEIDNYHRNRDINPKSYKTVTHLGVSASKMDTFHCVTNEGTSVIIYGKKGDIEI